MQKKKPKLNWNNCDQDQFRSQKLSPFFCILIIIIYDRPYARVRVHEQQKRKFFLNQRKNEREIERGIGRKRDREMERKRYRVRERERIKERREREETEMGSRFSKNFHQSSFTTNL